ncbi:MAG: UbiA family prenyltransferase [Glaciihabitans sp.]
MLSTVSALARSTHPGPTVAVTAITVLLGFGVGLGPVALLLLGLSMLANQVSVGLSNDWIDAERDKAVGRRDKPVALGEVTVAIVRAVAWASAAASVLLMLPLGVPAALAQAVFIASAWGYNAVLKGTAASVVPYIVSFGLLPVIVTLSLPDPSGAAWWAIAAGALLGVAAHFTNVLPDLEDDRRTGVRGLPHRLGRRVSGLVTFIALATATVLVVTGAMVTPPVLGWVGLLLGLAVTVLGGVLVVSRPPTRLLFQLIIAGALINVALLALSGEAVIS